MSKSQPPHLPSTDPALFSSTVHLAQTTNQPSTAKAEVAHFPADDPAVLIGLALAFVRQQPGGAGAVPAPILVRLVAYAGQGNAASRLVLSWLKGRSQPVALLDPPHEPSEDTGRPSVSLPRKTPLDRVMERLSGIPPQAVQPRGRKRPRWHLFDESKAGNAPETVSADQETSHG